MTTRRIPLLPILKARGACPSACAAIAYRKAKTFADLWMSKPSDFPLYYPPDTYQLETWRHWLTWAFNVPSVNGYRPPREVDAAEVEAAILDWARRHHPDLLVPR